MDQGEYFIIIGRSSSNFRILLSQLVRHIVVHIEEKVLGSEVNDERGGVMGEADRWEPVLVVQASLDARSLQKLAITSEEYPLSSEIYATSNCLFCVCGLELSCLLSARKHLPV